MPIISLIIAEMHIEMKEYLEKDIPLFAISLEKELALLKARILKKVLE